MKDDRFQRLEELFLAASRLEPDQRAEFLDRACAEDASLRAEVEGLLAQDTDPHELMKTLAFGKGVQRAAVQALDAAATDPTEEGSRQDSLHVELPQRIGAYRIIRRIGAGGMGVVYEAEQEHPRRLVALKVIRHGLASRSAMRRFEHESQILARLRHPGIAQVYEAGTHHDVAGTVPFFAMEYLADAKPITDYADTNGLSTGQKLQLFIQVCEAVHHGHQKGIIHRDLKPSNILVDAQGHAKIIDFGVARSTDADLAITTQQTDIGQIVGTLQYMSPEQCEGDPDNLDTRSDVYALGVVLYELLSGRLPYSVGMHNALRIIREEQPTRLTTLDKTFDKDIETIVFKALEKESARRYQSAVELAEDIRAYLRGEPIRARPQSTVYVLRKFVKRNRTLVALTLAVFLALVSGIVASTTFAIRARDSEREARWQAYAANIKAAEFALSINDVTAVRRHLALAPADSRGWEWAYLQAGSDTSLAVFEEHDAIVVAAKFSEDCSRLTTATTSGSVYTWDMGERRLFRKRRYDPGFPVSVVLNHDGSLVAMPAADGALTIWNTVTDIPYTVLPTNIDRVEFDAQIAFSPDDTLLAVGSYSGPITLWSLPDGQVVLTLPGHDGLVGALAFSPDGSQLASGGFHARDMTVRVWDVHTGELLRKTKAHNGGVWSISFSPDGKRSASASQDNTVRLWDSAAGREPSCPLAHADDVASAVFSADGRILVSATASGMAWLWDPETGRKVGALRGHSGGINALAISSDGASLASASADMTVRIWDGSGEPAQAVLWGHSQSVSAVAFSPDSRYLASGSADGCVVVWDLATRTQVARRAVSDGDIPSVAFNRDGTLVASALGDNGIHVWSWMENRVLPPLRGHTKSVGHVHFSPERNVLVSASADQTVRLWDVSSGRELAVLTGHTDRVLTAVFSSDGQRIVSGSVDGTVCVWDARGHDTLWRVRLGDSGYRAMFTPDDRYVVTYSGRTPIEFLDAATGGRHRMLRGTETSFIAFSPCGKRLAAIMRDYDLHLLDAATGDEFLHFRGHDGERVRTVAFSPDGTRVASAGHDQTVHIWDIVPYRIRYMERKAAEAMKDGVVDQAEPLNRRVLMEIRAVLGNDHRGTLAPLRRLVESLIAQNKFAEAEPLAVECYQRSEAAYPAKNGNILTALKLLIGLYKRWGRHDQAIKWREELALTDSEPAEG